MDTKAAGLTTLLLMVGCGAPSLGDFQRLPPEAPRPDFALEDVNPASATLGQTLGPVGHRGSVSAWYFGHST